MNYFKMIFLVFIFSQNLYAQVVLSEIMYDPDTLEYYCEYIEIFNNSDYAVNLDGWRIGVPSDTDQIISAVPNINLILKPKMYGLILDSGYLPHDLSVYNIPDSNCLLLTIEDGAFGKNGLPNSKEDTIVLLSNIETVQKYKYTLNNMPGYSLEKINLESNNNDINWGTSIFLRGTPGSKNSLAQAENNISAGCPKKVNANYGFYVKNSGKNFFNNYISYNLYFDSNFDNVFNTHDFIAASSQIKIELNSQDSLFVIFNFNKKYFGKWSTKIIFETNDEIQTDNFASGVININIPQDSLIINELMISPRFYGEWMEIYNISSATISLWDLIIKDNSDSSLIGKTFINPSEYCILCQEQAQADIFNNELKKSIAIPWVTLNNSLDNIFLLNNSKEIVDEAYYDFSEMKIELDIGISLERIKPYYLGSDVWNWALCTNTNGNTAGQKNSVYYGFAHSNTKLNITPNPFSPNDDGLDDVCKISLETIFEIMDLKLIIFSLNGRVEREWNIKQIPGKYNLIWDGKNKNSQKLPLGLYIVYVEMRNKQDGKKIIQKKSLVLAY